MAPLPDAARLRLANERVRSVAVGHEDHPYLDLQPNCALLRAVLGAAPELGLANDPLLYEMVCLGSSFFQRWYTTRGCALAVVYTGITPMEPELMGKDYDERVDLQATPPADPSEKDTWWEAVLELEWNRRCFRTRGIGVPHSIIREIQCSLYHRELIDMFIMCVSVAIGELSLCARHPTEMADTLNTLFLGGDTWDSQDCYLDNLLTTIHGNLGDTSSLRLTIDGL